jgi:ABC-type antimicrobial peptide transport system permease subunit
MPTQQKKMVHAMRFASIILGSRFSWRNKRRTIIATIGLVIATAVFSSLFLITSFQDRVTILSNLNAEDRHLTIYRLRSIEYGDRYNVTDFEMIDSLIDEIAARRESIDPSVEYSAEMPADQVYVDEEGHLIQREIFFPTINESIDWDNLNITWRLASIEYRARSDLGKYFDSKIISGTLPSGQNELAISESVAMEQNLTVNDTIKIGNNLTRRLFGDFRISSILEDSDSYPARNIVLPIETLVTLVQNLTVSMNAVLDSFSINVKFNTESFNLYNINPFLEQVNVFAVELQGALNINQGGYEVLNRINWIQQGAWQINMGAILNFTLIMAPLILLALYLARFISKEMLKAREPELALLKSRGLPSGQVKRIVATELTISSVVSAGVSGCLSVLFSYMLVPLSYIGPLRGIDYTSEYNPFPNLETFGIFISIVIATSFLFNFIVQFSDLNQMLEKDVKTPVELAVLARQKKINWNISLTLMFILGITPLAVQVLIFTTIIPVRFFGLDVLFGVLIVPAPFFLAAGIVKLLADRYPARFAKIFSPATRWLGRGAKVLVERKFMARGKSISQLVIMIALTVGFSLATSILSQNIPLARDEFNNVKLAGDIKVPIQANFTRSVQIQQDLEQHENITHVSRLFYSFGYINQDAFKYKMQFVYFTNITEMEQVSPIFKDSYLLEGEWDDIAAAFDSAAPAVLLPAYYKGLFNTTSISIDILMEMRINGGSGDKTWGNTFTIVGYYKFFPAIYWGNSDKQSYSVSWDSYPIIVNLASISDAVLSMPVQSSIVSNVSGLEMPFTYLIDTTVTEQSSIDELGSSLNMTGQLTMTDMIREGIGISQGLLDNPSIPGLLRVVTATSLVISLLGYSLVAFMQISGDRHEIGILRVRGFNEKMIGKIYAAEHFLPFLAGVTTGIICGVFGGLFFLNMVIHDFHMFSFTVHFVPSLQVNPLDLLLMIAAPILVIFFVARYSIRREYAKDFAEIMAVED